MVHVSSFRRVDGTSSTKPTRDRTVYGKEKGKYRYVKILAKYFFVWAVKNEYSKKY